MGDHPDRRHDDGVQPKDRPAQGSLETVERCFFILRFRILLAVTGQDCTCWQNSWNFWDRSGLFLMTLMMDVRRSKMTVFRSSLRNGSENQGRLMILPAA